MGASLGNLAADFGARAQFPEPSGVIFILLFMMQISSFSISAAPTASDIPSNLTLCLRLYCSSLSLLDFGELILFSSYSIVFSFYDFL